MKICLVRCPSPFLVEDHLLPPLGLMAVGTALKEHGHDVQIQEGINSHGFDAYGFGPTTPEYPYALGMKDVIKRQNRKAKVVLGGPHATINPEECMKDGWDCIVTGDGEVAGPEAFNNGKSLVVGQERPLDEYPIINRKLLNIHSYRYTLNGKLATTMMTSQGCPYHCAFCAKNYSTVRFRSAEKVIRELRTIHYEYGYEAVAFPEDVFILNRERTEEICLELFRLGMIYRCLGRADFIVKYGMSFVHLLANTGCVDMSIGIESGSDTILKNINKGENIATMKKAIRMIKDAGIRIKGFFIVGLPGESPETLDETWKFLEEMQLDNADFKMFQPYPGTPIWNHREKYDIQWDDMDEKDMFYKGRIGDYRGSIRTSSLTTAQIVEAWIDLEATYKRA